MGDATATIAIVIAGAVFTGGFDGPSSHQVVGATVAGRTGRVASKGGFSGGDCETLSRA